MPIRLIAVLALLGILSGVSQGQDAAQPRDAAPTETAPQTPPTAPAPQAPPVATDQQRERSQPPASAEDSQSRANQAEEPDDSFVPTEELQPDAAVTFPVDI